MATKKLHKSTYNIFPIRSVGQKVITNLVLVLMLGKSVSTALDH